MKKTILALAIGLVGNLAQAQTVTGIPVEPKNRPKEILISIDHVRKENEDLRVPPPWLATQDGADAPPILESFEVFTKVITSWTRSELRPIGTLTCISGVGGVLSLKDVYRALDVSGAYGFEQAQCDSVVRALTERRIKNVEVRISTQDHTIKEIKGLGSAE